MDRVIAGHPSQEDIDAVAALELRHGRLEAWSIASSQGLGPVFDHIGICPECREDFYRYEVWIRVGFGYSIVRKIE